MNKHILLLSAAMAVLIAGPAGADDWTDITTALKVPVNTAAADNGAPGDIVLDSVTSGSTTNTGSITVTLDAPAVTINSNNSFEAVAGTTISNMNTTGASGILVDLTTQSWDATNDAASCNGAPPCHTVEGIVAAGTINLTGTGDTKRGLWLQGPTTGGPFSFTGDINMAGSTMNITGDNSVGVLIDPLATLNGNLTLGSMTLNPTSTASTAGIIGLEVGGVVNGDISVGTVNGTVDSPATIAVNGSKTSTALSVFGLDLTGTINGNVTISASSEVNVAGDAAEGVLLTGSINACNMAVVPSCTSIGSFVNNGVISTVGTNAALTSTLGNVDGGSALAIGGSIAGGIYNAGPLSSTDSTALASISAQVSGTTAGIVISPSLQTATAPTPITIGVYTPDIVDPGFSFYNRGIIDVAPSSDDESVTAVNIEGDTSTAKTTLTGGLFNSHTISATAVSTAASDQGVAVNATALEIGADALIGPNDVYDISTCNLSTGVCNYTNTASTKIFGDQASLVNSGAASSGTIEASISGPEGGEADAIVISAGATLPSLINSGTIQAVATTSDTAIVSLTAVGIRDLSGTLTYIQNNGTINAEATTLGINSQIADAIDLSDDNINEPAVNGVAIIDQATANSNAVINGNILFGSGDSQIVDVLGASTSNVATITGNIAFGGGSFPGFGSDKLTIGSFATVKGTVTAANGVDVDVQNGGTFIITNNTAGLTANTFTVETGGTLNMTVLETFTTGIVNAQGAGAFASIDSGAKLNITYGSFIPSNSEFVLITAPTGTLQVPDLATYNAQLAANQPFLFESATLAEKTVAASVTDQLVLDVVPKNASQLGLTGYAATLLPFANQALSNDDVLGAAMVAGITTQKQAQQAYEQFAPDVSGAARGIAISLTDQSSGPVSDRQRTLRMYGKADGEVTLWGQEFAEYLKDPGDPSAGRTGFKDHGFGFVLGLDGGEPKTGWYGGAFSFYSGNMVEPAPNDANANSLWYMLTGYTDWRGRGLFLDTKADVAYVSITQKRFLDLTIPNATGSGSTTLIDEADSKRPGVVGSLGFTTGAIFDYGSTTLTPQLSVDGMTMREEGYSESHAGGITPAGLATGNGKGFDLDVDSYYANSLRAFLGTEIREDLNLGDFFVQPDVRLGYRYDFINDAEKLKANFANIGDLSTPTPGPQFTLEGPDPSQGNFVAGASLSATTDAWTLGADFDFVRGTDGATTEVGTIHLLGRI